jgi:hypothetical protein
MKNFDKQELDTGLDQDNKKKPSSVASQPKKIKSESGKDQETTPPLTNGSPTLETQKVTPELSESEADNGSSTIRQKKPKSLMPVPKLSALESRTLQALKRLKVKPEALQSLPQITPMLKKSLKGGLRTALEAMRFATNDEVVADFLRVYDKIPIGDRDRLPWEAIMIKAKVNPIYLLGAIQMAVQTYSWNKSRFLAVSSHPEITKNRIKFAKMAGGVKDREALDIVNGFLQSPKGPTFIGKQVAVFGGNGGGQNNNGGGNVVDAEVDGDDGFENLFPSPNEIQDKLVPIRQRLLEG